MWESEEGATYHSGTNIIRKVEKAYCVKNAVTASLLRSKLKTSSIRGNGFAVSREATPPAVASQGWGKVTNGYDTLLLVYG